MNRILQAIEGLDIGRTVRALDKLLDINLAVHGALTEARQRLREVDDSHRPSA